MIEFTKVPDYPDYEISRCGIVISNRTAKSKELKGSVDRDGYLRFGLCNSDGVKTNYIHQMLAMIFLGHTIDGHNVVVDHINNDCTDNRLENLQLISHRENLSKDKKGCSSKFTGVNWDKPTGKWRSQIRINGKAKHLGLFKCELKAAMTYNKALKSIV